MVPFTVAQGSEGTHVDLMVKGDVLAATNRYHFLIPLYPCVPPQPDILAKQIKQIARLTSGLLCVCTLPMEAGRKRREINGRKVAFNIDLKAHTQDDHIPIEMTSLEQFLRAQDFFHYRPHRQKPTAYPSSRFAPEPIRGGLRRSPRAEHLAVDMGAVQRKSRPSASWRASSWSWRATKTDGCSRPVNAPISVASRSE